MKISNGTVTSKQNFIEKYHRLFLYGSLFIIYNSFVRLHLDCGDILGKTVSGTRSPIIKRQEMAKTTV